MTGRDERPAFEGKSFRCPHCGVVAQQDWLRSAGDGTVPLGTDLGRLLLSRCHRCQECACWYGRELVYPAPRLAPPPNRHLPEDVRRLYDEAAGVVHASPRCAAALLRLALKLLMPHLGEGDLDLTVSVQGLAGRGLSPTIQHAMTALRVTGPGAAQPGLIDWSDGRDTALALFQVVNMTVQDRIGHQKEIQDALGSLPQSHREGITSRPSK